MIIALKDLEFSYCAIGEELWFLKRWWGWGRQGGQWGSDPLGRGEVEGQAGTKKAGKSLWNEEVESEPQSPGWVYEKALSNQSIPGLLPLSHNHPYGYLSWSGPLLQSNVKLGHLDLDRAAGPRGCSGASFFCFKIMQVCISDNGNFLDLGTVLSQSEQTLDPSGQTLSHLLHGRAAAEPQPGFGLPHIWKRNKKKRFWPKSPPHSPSFPLKPQSCPRVRAPPGERAALTGWREGPGTPIPTQTPPLLGSGDHFPTEPLKGRLSNKLSLQLLSAFFFHMREI